ncbi:hypothetical protein OJAV_G00124830 [Oryzias javanicus]|uniref:Uncharacterized protein n=1 Tax=Oryzias javanicus TaxID=123683 RepID=A0A3S2Q0B5_ORYJA|nr:hypothetical protein OJAV_G00124830 [Oryzias javanicus]
MLDGSSTRVTSGTDTGPVNGTRRPEGREEVLVMLSRPATPTEPASPPVSLMDLTETRTGDCSPPRSPRSPPPAVPPCSCSSLLTRLLAVHRLEVRRLLRGALATISHRLEVLERRSRRRRRRTPNRGARVSGSPVSSSSLFTSDTPASFTRSDFSSLTSLSSADSEETPSCAESNQPEPRRRRRSTKENLNGAKRRKVLHQRTENTAHWGGRRRRRRRRRRGGVSAK